MIWCFRLFFMMIVMRDHNNGARHCLALNMICEIVQRPDTQYNNREIEYILLI